MAEIYKIPKGVRTRGKDRLNFVAAHHRKTLTQLTIIQAETEVRSKAILAQSKTRTGQAKPSSDTPARITTHTGKNGLDKYVDLIHPKAFQIETEGVGRNKIPPLRGAMRG